MEINREVFNIRSTTEGDNTLRFRGASWYDIVKDKDILCGGCGGIMSNTIFQLARLNPNRITVYDPDTVEYVNLAGQMFGKSNIGDTKVHSIANIISEFSDYNKISCITGAVPTGVEYGNSIMISGFDNMFARRNFFNLWSTYIDAYMKDHIENTLYIDARLSFDTAQIIAFKGNDEYAFNKYKDNYLFTDIEADATICSRKQTSFMTGIIASLITNIFVNFCENQATSLTFTPWFIEYNSNTMTLKTLE